ncbi:TPA: restriction endonuclease subunit S [Neisseria subflava]
MDKQQEPRLRFKGFTGAWEEKRLSDVVEIVGGGTPDTNNSAYWGGEIDWYSPTEIGENVYANGSIRKITLLGLQKSSAVILPADRTVLFTSRASIGDMAILTKQGATNQGFQSFIVREGLNIYFLYTMGFKIKEYALKNASGSTFLEISKTQLLQMESLFPSLTEQTHLGLFFRRLDSQIAESRAVLEKSRQLKKAMLAKMFPANSEKLPKIRFKGFAGEWESRKLGIEVEIIGGGTPDTTNSAYWNGDIDWYSPTEIGEAAYANGSVKKITLLGLQKSSAQILPANRTVLFTSRASIGDMAILTRDGATNQGFQSFVVGERLDVYFLYTMGFKIKDYALKNASGSTFLEISKNTLSQMEFFAPSLKEQTAIGNFFRQLDETIALQSAEVEKLNQLKKGLLAAMLV